MTHKSRYLPICRTLPAVAACATRVACSARPPATGPGRAEPAATPLTAELQTTSEALAQHLARALTHPAFRAYVKEQLDSSPFREHKLHFQRFLGAHGGHARDEVARHAGVPAGQIDREALAPIPLEFYFPVPAHRRARTRHPHRLGPTPPPPPHAPPAPAPPRAPPPPPPR